MLESRLKALKCWVQCQKKHLRKRTSHWKIVSFEGTTRSGYRDLPSAAAEVAKGLAPAAEACPQQLQSTPGAWLWLPGPAPSSYRARQGQGSGHRGLPPAATEHAKGWAPATEVNLQQLRQGLA